MSTGQQSRSVLDSLATLSRGDFVSLHLDSGESYEACVSKTSLSVPDEDAPAGVVNYAFWAAEGHVEDGDLPKDDLAVVAEWSADEETPDFDLSVWDPEEDAPENRQTLGTLERVERVERDGGQQTDAPTQDDREDLQRVQSAVASVTESAATAVKRSSGIVTSALPASDLSDTHDALLDTMQDTRRALDRVEQTMDRRDPDYGRPTPRQVTSEHADRLKEQYDGAVLNLALMLLDRNRRKWLHEKPETNGADAVRRHGLTENQRRWLNSLQDAWREYNGE